MSLKLSASIYAQSLWPQHSELEINAKVHDAQAKDEKILRRLSVRHYIRPKHLFQQNDKHQIVHCLLKAVLVFLSRSHHQLKKRSLIHLKAT